jgi:hypothetical protein
MVGEREKEKQKQVEAQRKWARQHQVLAYKLRRLRQLNDKFDEAHNEEERQGLLEDRNRLIAEMSRLMAAGRR